jgi:anti-anti-sigma factor
MELQLKRPSTCADGADEVTVVHFTGSSTALDEVAVQKIHDQLLALADGAGESDLLLDFGPVEYVGSLALDTLVRLHHKLLVRGRRMTVENLRPQVHEVFAVTGLDELLTLRLAGQASGPVPEGGPAMSLPGVLVADDEAAVQSVLAAGLRRAGFKVWLAADGDQAVDLYRRHRNEIAVVLLDVEMPGMDGPHTLLALHKLCPAIRCCFMTGNPSDYTEETLRCLGAERVFRKPFALTEVFDTLNQLTGRFAGRRHYQWVEIPLQRSVNDVGAESQGRGSDCDRWQHPIDRAGRR